jgi:uncharacterized protein (DUF433 family)
LKKFLKRFAFGGVNTDRCPMEKFIVVDPAICTGKPVLKGTRILVKNIIGMVAGGYTVDRILQAYPELT